MADNTRQIHVGALPVGGGAPVSVQSMTNTRTEDVQATAAQIARLEAAGCDIVRVAAPNMAAARAIAKLKEGTRLPIVADIHFDYRLAIASAEAGADKIRINPGNIGGEENVRAVARCCRERGIPIRIGINGGSLERRLLEKYGGATPEAMCESALSHAALLEKYDFTDICLSLKASDTALTVAAYRRMAELSRYPLHLGVTEAGGEYMGVIKSAVGIGSLLLGGIGDTLRVSLTAEPEAEVRAGIAILKAAGLRRDGVNIISCPTCGRCEIDLIALSRQVEERLRDYRGDVTVAVMGCVVNGPGEAAGADYGVAGGRDSGVLFRRGVAVATAPQSELADRLIAMIHEEKQ